MESLFPFLSLKIVSLRALLKNAGIIWSSVQMVYLEEFQYYVWNSLLLIFFIVTNLSISSTEIRSEQINRTGSHFYILTTVHVVVCLLSEITEVSTNEIVLWMTLFRGNIVPDNFRLKISSDV